MRYTSWLILMLIYIAGSCKKPIKQQEDKVYSRHLQRYVHLTVITTPMPEEKGDMNLLLILENEQHPLLSLKELADSCYRSGSLRPFMIVAVAGKSTEYGMSNITARAEKFTAFCHNELYPFIKKKTGVRKFSAVLVAGTGNSAISALDIGWQHSDKFSTAGLILPNFGDAGMGGDGLPATIESIRSSRKRPVIAYWIACPSTDTVMLQGAAQLDNILRQKNISPGADIAIFPKGEIGNDATGLHNALARFMNKTLAKQ